jgi:outer membrane protein assembly factor BamB
MFHRRILPLWLVGIPVLVAGAAFQDPERPQEPQVGAELQADWPIYRGSPALEGVAAGSLGSNFELAWSFETGDAIVSSPVVVGNTVYVGSSDQSVYAVDLATGEKRWSFATDDIVDAPPMVYGGRVYVGSYDFFFYVLDAATGKLIWKYETGDKIVGSANWFKMPDGSIRILVGSYDYMLHCFDAATGKKLWEYETDNFINGTPAILNGQIVFGGCDAVLHVVSAATGEVIDQVPLDSGSQVAGSVALAGNKVYFGHYGNEFICGNLETRELEWAYPSRNQPFVSSPAIGPDRVIIGGQDKKLHCVRRSDGEPLWTFPTRRRIDGSPVICGDKVVFGAADGRLYVVNLDDGSEVWSYEVGQPINSSPAIAKGMILIGSDDGRLYAFRATSGK